MGSFTSRQNVGVEEVDISVNNAYRYPPKSGNYFSTHFIMGGERFETAYPEMYLFGENLDLNFLGSRPAPFPYPAPSTGEPSRTLKALVNIRKESLRFVRIPEDSMCLKESSESPVSSTQFNIEFTFDCDVRCAITILYFCTEEVTSGGLVYTPKDPSMNSETYHYKKGSNQQFSQVCHVFDPVQYPEESLTYSAEKDVLPIVIYCVAEEGEEPFQSHSTIAIVEKHSDGYCLKPLKQKLFVDGLCYLLQEIYGIENKHAETKIGSEEEPDDNGAECVICMCDLRDTLILPCRHLCLCNCCADSLRFQANNCPICRVPFRALLQIKALQRIPDGAITTNVEVGENVPTGYEPVSLIEALNGPSVTPQQPPAPACPSMYVQLSQSATDAGLDRCVEATRVQSLQQRNMIKTSKWEGGGGGGIVGNETHKPLPGMMALDEENKSSSTTDRRKRKDSDLSRCRRLSETSAREGSEELVTAPSVSVVKNKTKSKRRSEESVQIEQPIEVKQGKEPTCKIKWRSSPPDSPAYSPFPPKGHLSPRETHEETEGLTEKLTLLENFKDESDERDNRKTEDDGGMGNNYLDEVSVSAIGPFQLPQGRRSPTVEEAVNPSMMQFEDELIGPSSNLEVYSDAPDTVEVHTVDSTIGDDGIQQESSGDISSTGDPTDLVSGVIISSTTTGSQSLPGTPSSPMSRSSDISATSVSSTKALILSNNPSNFSTAV